MVVVVDGPSSGRGDSSPATAGLLVVVVVVGEVSVVVVVLVMVVLVVGRASAFGSGAAPTGRGEGGGDDTGGAALPISEEATLVVVVVVAASGTRASPGRISSSTVCDWPTGRSSWPEVRSPPQPTAKTSSSKTDTKMQRMSLGARIMSRSPSRPRNHSPATSRPRPSLVVASGGADTAARVVLYPAC